MDYNNNNNTNYFRNEKLFIPGLEWSHVALKRVFTLVDNKLKGWRPTTNDDVHTMSKAVKQIDGFMNSCKNNEQTVAWPYLKSHDQAAIPVLAKSDSMRETYEAKMSDLITLLSKFEQKDIKDISNDELSQVSPKFTEAKQEMSALLHYQEINILPFFMATSKEEQTKFAKQIQELSKKNPNAKFVFSAMMDSIKKSNDKELQESFSKNSPWVARKLVKSVFSKKAYGWFVNFVEA